MEYNYYLISDQLPRSRISKYSSFTNRHPLPSASNLGIFSKIILYIPSMIVMILSESVINMGFPPLKPANASLDSLVGESSLNLQVNINLNLTVFFHMFNRI